MGAVFWEDGLAVAEDVGILIVGALLNGVAVVGGDVVGMMVTSLLGALDDGPAVVGAFDGIVGDVGAGDELLVVGLDVDEPGLVEVLIGIGVGAFVNGGALGFGVGARDGLAVAEDVGKVVVGPLLNRVLVAVGGAVVGILVTSLLGAPDDGPAVVGALVNGIVGDVGAGDELLVVGLDDTGLVEVIGIGVGAIVDGGLGFGVGARDGLAVVLVGASVLAGLGMVVNCSALLLATTLAATLRRSP